MRRRDQDGCCILLRLLSRYKASSFRKLGASQFWPWPGIHIELCKTPLQKETRPKLQVCQYVCMAKSPLGTACAHGDLGAPPRGPKTRVSWSDRAKTPRWPRSRIVSRRARKVAVPGLNSRHFVKGLERITDILYRGKEGKLSE